MSQGTWASYQGHPCASVVFRRARGFAASISEVEIPVSSFPASFNWRDAQSELERRPAVEAVDVTPGLSDQPRLLGQLADGLAYEGTLVLAEEANRVLSVPGLVVVRIETSQQGDDGQGPVFVRLTLADERLFYGRGILRRWRWNVRLPSGDLALDTVKANGSLHTLEEVAREVVEGHWRKPELGRTPASWRSTEREVELAPFPRATEALASLVTLGQAEDPCLQLDGKLSIFRPGEGLLGYAPDGKGPNAAALPPEVFLDEDGAGTRVVSEANWPAEIYLVAGQARVATVALDGWEPVLMISGRPQFLSEELVRSLTGGRVGREIREGDRVVTDTRVDGGRYGLEWLKKWVMLGNADQGADGVREDVLKIFAEQAWNLWRMPGVEKIRRGFYTGEPGPNAHLVPMLPRAETAGEGRRLPPAIFSASWSTKRLKWSATEEAQQLRRAKESLQRVRASITLRFTREGKSGRDPLTRKPIVPLGPTNLPDFARRAAQFHGLSARDLNCGEDLPAGVDREDFQQALTEFRRIQQLKDEGLNEEASQYERLLLEKVRAESALAGDERTSVRALTYETAKEAVEWERQAGESVSPVGAEGFLGGAVAGDLLGSRDGIKQSFKRQFGERFQNKIQELARVTNATRRRTQANLAAGRPAGQPISPVFLKNSPRRLDTGGRVYSAEFGIVRTGKRAGNVDREDLNDPKLATFLPVPPRVLFGATLRPRVDQTSGEGGRPVTGVQRPLGVEVTNLILGGILGDPGIGDRIPNILTDQESFYASAWRRIAPGRVEAVPLEEAPLDRATAIRRTWQELVPLEGVGNRAELDREAEKIAREASRKLDRTTSKTVSLVGPWPVNCDGVVAAVEIRSGVASGAICGFTTTVLVGGSALVDPGRTRTR